MSQYPQPLFETFDRFHSLNFFLLGAELPSVRALLLDLPEERRAVEGYRAVRGFLKSYAGNEATFNSYRTHVERLLLWTLLVAEKPLLELRRRDAESFMEFCLTPPAELDRPCGQVAVLTGWQQKNTGYRFLRGQPAVASLQLHSGKA
jgi:hypothetical protein